MTNSYNNYRKSSRIAGRKTYPKFQNRWWTFRDELAILDDVVYKGPKVVIPTSMHKDMLKCLHVIIIITITSFAPISSKIKLSGATKPRD